MKTKSLIIALLLTRVFVACSPAAQIVDSWRDPNTSLQTGQIHKFIVAALLKDQAFRRTVEDQMASYMPGKAVQSYVEFGTENLKDNQDVYNQNLKSEGYDGIVIMRLANVDTNKRFVMGTHPAYYGSWRPYWGYSWSAFYSPGYYTTDKTYYIEVNVYSLKQDKLIWTGTTSTINPENNGELFKNVSKAVYKKMKKEGFLQY